MTTVLTVTATDIVERALRLTRSVDPNQSIPAYKVQNSLEALNFLVKSMQAKGHLWIETEGILFLDVGRTNYKLGPNGDEAGNADDFENTEMAVAGITTDTILTLDSTSGMEGQDDLFPTDPSESTDGWVLVDGFFSVVATSLKLSNTAAQAGLITRTTPTLVVGRVYHLIADFTKGLSPSITYSIKDGVTTLGSVALTASGTGRFEFTATQTTHTLELLNGDTAGTNDTITDKLLLLDDTTGDFIGIELDDGTRQWTRIVQVINSTQVFNTDGLTSAAAIDNTVFSFPKLTPRPLRIDQLRRQTIGLNDEIEANQWTRQEYFAQPDKNGQGEVNNWYYSPQLSEGQLYLWQTANTVNKMVNFTYRRPIEVNETTADNPDFPAEWFDALTYTLAVRIAPENKTNTERMLFLKNESREMMDDALGFDLEPGALQIQPDL